MWVKVVYFGTRERAVPAPFPFLTPFPPFGTGEGLCQSSARLAFSFPRILTQNPKGESDTASEAALRWKAPTALAEDKPRISSSERVLHMLRGERE